MKAATLTLVFLIIFGVTATLCAGVGGPVQRCLCAGVLLPRVKRQNIGKMEVFLSSPSCPKTEIVTTLKRTGQKLCLDPDGKQGQMILKQKIVKLPKRGPKRARGKKKRQP
ncbi:C-X-C motif chemokine 10-like [Brachyhypopomus gauderio]|uniref:C-X-C motif chemokine 10-like n=1 Tax=Brachyhypopomus gauderio TaxID=698409 RepID=UPI00404179AD